MVACAGREYLCHPQPEAEDGGRQAALHHTHVVLSGGRLRLGRAREGIGHHKGHALGQGHVLSVQVLRENTPSQRHTLLVCAGLQLPVGYLPWPSRRMGWTSQKVMPHGRGAFQVCRCHKCLHPVQVRIMRIQSGLGLLSSAC